MRENRMDGVKSYSVKKLAPGDVELAQQLFLFFQIDDQIENPTSAADEYLRNLLARDDFHVLVAVENQKVIGGLTAYELAKYKREAKEMFLYEIAVESGHRRKGVGRALIEFLKQICLEKDISEMFVGALSANTPAVKLYQATGGKGAAVIEFYYELK